MGKLTFILGGARSGKSSYAQKLAAQHSGQVLYLATAQAMDDEMSARIESHRRERPAHWTTLEISRDLAVYLKEKSINPDLVLLDCLTLLVSNVMLQAVSEDEVADESAALQSVNSEIESLLAFINAGIADWIVVSNEVGLGLVPPYPLGRLYRDLQGWANQRLAAQADEVIFMVSGIPMRLNQEN